MISGCGVCVGKQKLTAIVGMITIIQAGVHVVRVVWHNCVGKIRGAFDGRVSVGGARPCTRENLGVTTPGGALALRNFLHAKSFPLRQMLSRLSLSDCTIDCRHERARNWFIRWSGVAGASLLLDDVGGRCDF